MELSYLCPRCGSEQVKGGADSATVLTCDRCDYAGLLPLDWMAAGQVERCPICGGGELFRQRDFNQRLGILVLVVGTGLAVFTRVLSLLAAALFDLILYLTSPEVLVCYRCRARIRGHRPSGRHGRFDPRVEVEVRQSAERADRQDLTRP